MLRRALFLVILHLLIAMGPFAAAQDDTLDDYSDGYYYEDNEETDGQGTHTSKPGDPSVTQEDAISNLAASHGQNKLPERFRRVDELVATISSHAGSQKRGGVADLYNHALYILVHAYFDNLLCVLL